jgi:tetratricopeptide (TPR) repeat protein
VGDVLGRPQAANLGDRTGALSSYGKARALLERFLADNGPDPEVRRQLARLLINLYELYAFDGAQLDRADETIDETTRMWEALLRDDPTAEANLRGLASVHFMSFTHYRRTGTRAAQPYMERALEMFQALLDARPADSDRKRNVALCHKYLAGYFLDSDPLRSIHHARVAAQLDGERVAADAHNAAAKLDYSFDLSLLADYSIAREEYREALGYFTEALSLRRALWEADRVDVRVADRLVYMLTRAGETHVILEEHVRGLPLLREALTRIGDMTADKRATRHTMFLRSYAAMGEAQWALEQEHCAADRQAAELDRTTPPKEPVLEAITRKLVNRAVERARACGDGGTGRVARVR